MLCTGFCVRNPGWWHCLLIREGQLVPGNLGLSEARGVPSVEEHNHENRCGHGSKPAPVKLSRPRKIFRRASGDATLGQGLWSRSSSVFDLQHQWKFRHAPGAQNCGELLAAPRTLREMLLMTRHFFCGERSFVVGRQNVRLGTCTARRHVARKASPEQAIHRLFIIPRSHELILLP
jgi:hypothetical protein